MKTENRLNDKIFKKTMEIQQLFPELYVFLDEMMVFNNSDFIKAKKNRLLNLLNYYYSLEALLDSYILNAKIQRNSP